MASHQFALQQIVRFETKSNQTNLSPDGFYEVIRLLPEDTAGILSYRLKSSAGERIAREIELTALETQSSIMVDSTKIKIETSKARLPAKPDHRRFIAGWPEPASKGPSNAIARRTND